MTTIIGSFIDREAVSRARTRLEALVQRRDIDVARYADPPYANDAQCVNALLDALHWADATEYGPSRGSKRAGIATFRRAIGSRRATFLHINDGRAYEAW